MKAFCLIIVAAIAATSGCKPVAPFAQQAAAKDSAVEILSMSAAKPAAPPTEYREEDNGTYTPPVENYPQPQAPAANDCPGGVCGPRRGFRGLIFRRW